MSDISVIGLAGLTNCADWHFEPLIKCGFLSTSVRDPSLTYEADGGYIHGYVCKTDKPDFYLFVSGCSIGVVLLIVLFILIGRYLWKRNPLPEVELPPFMRPAPRPVVIHSNT